MTAYNIDSLLHQLGYDESPHYYRTQQVDTLSPETAHLFRNIEKTGIDGIYFFDTGPDSRENYHPPRPAVYVAQAATPYEARQIHRRLWNLCNVPFLIIKLPHQIRVYTGFNYSEKDEKQGFIDEFGIDRIRELNELLEDFKASSIDTGMIWKSQYARKLDSSQRVDSRLLKNIEQLGETLIKDGGLTDGLANALIGKYIYLKYLYDRNILTDRWMSDKQINKKHIFSPKATVPALEELVNELEKRFNGKIFPIDLGKKTLLEDKHVKWVATVFGGGEIVESETAPDPMKRETVASNATPKVILQLPLEFKSYDFEYIPVETLSAIYEQFIVERKVKGAVYTPEVLADYLIAEMELVNPLEKGMKVLDPACGSGIFLVLIYRLLIEKEIHRSGRKLSPQELLDILESSIYGVEREQDACYVTEFGLILTLLHYLDPRDLQSIDFRFPSLHNRQIYECDFFDIKGKDSDAKFWHKSLKFDWVIGNPPWIALNKAFKRKENEHAFAWMNNPENKNYHVGDYQTAEAFCWLVTELFSNDGTAGLLIPATSLVNKKALDYRKSFFKEHEVLRITNFANIKNLFGKRKVKYLPASIIYQKSRETEQKQRIIHFGPFNINQLLYGENAQWIITINENEIESISPKEAEAGKSLNWKTALWGNFIDKRTLERIQHTFPKTLNDLCLEKDWVFLEGPKQRSKKDKTPYPLLHVPELKKVKKFNKKSMKNSLSRLSIPASVLEAIPDEDCYIRKKDGKGGLSIIYAPHIILHYAWMKYIIYSDEDFLITSRHLGISSSNKEDAYYLRAISVYLKSSFVAYYLFFHTPQWGIFKEEGNQVNKEDVGVIPIPQLTPEQIDKLAKFQKKLVEEEEREISAFIQSPNGTLFDAGELPSQNSDDKSLAPQKLTKYEKERFDKDVKQKLQRQIDEEIYDIMGVPEDIRRTVKDFIDNRLPLDTPSKQGKLTRKPTEQEFMDYAYELRDYLDGFLGGKSYHQVTIRYSDELVECTVETGRTEGPIPIVDSNIHKASTTMESLMSELEDNLRQQLSQWVYVRHGLRLFDGPKVFLYRAPRLHDWTITQARIDASDIIGDFFGSNDK